jgi:SAM-dependent methyltransferase
MRLSRKHLEHPPAVGCRLLNWDDMRYTDVVILAAYEFNDDGPHIDLSTSRVTLRRLLVRATTAIGALHSTFIHQQRVDILAGHLASLIPRDATVLDVGTGDGLLAAEIGRRRSDLDISGIDVLGRKNTHISVSGFDGVTITSPDRSVDVVLFVDVLHHTVDPRVLLMEARRVARRAVVIKDHTCNGILAGRTLRLMDWVGNAPHGVVLPYNYWSSEQWHHAFMDLGFNASVWKQELRLYPVPVRWIFDRYLHFIAVLTPR